MRVYIYEEAYGIPPGEKKHDSRWTDFVGFFIQLYCFLTHARDTP